MQSEQEKQVCISIGRRLKSEFFVLFVQQMFTVSEAEIEFCVEECGGKKRWIRQLENLLGHQFKRLAINAPLSAHLVDNGSPEDFKDGEAGKSQSPHEQPPSSLPS